MNRRDSLDGRLTRPTSVKAMGRNAGDEVHGEVVFCMSCGHPAGRVTHGLPPGVFYLCATNPGGCGCNCEGRYGRPPEMLTKIPDPVDFQRVWQMPGLSAKG